MKSEGADERRRYIHQKWKRLATAYGEEASYGGLYRSRKGRSRVTASETSMLWSTQRLSVSLIDFQTQVKDKTMRLFDGPLARDPPLIISYSTKPPAIPHEKN